MAIPQVRTGDLLTTNKWNDLVKEINSLSGALAISGSKVKLGRSSQWEGKFTITHNSTVASPHLDLFEEGKDFARLSFRNSSEPEKKWHIAGYTSGNGPRLNFYYNDGKRGYDHLSITGGGRIEVANHAQLSFGNNTRQMINLWGKEYGIGVQGHTAYFRSHYNFAWYKRGGHNDATFNPGGGVKLMSINSAGDLMLSARTNPTGDPKKSLCRALVDYNNKLVINFGNDFAYGTYIVGNAGALKVVGRDHSYIEFYPKGIDLGGNRPQQKSSRWGWIGFGSSKNSDLGIGNAKGKVKLHSASDIRLKKDISPAEKLLDKVLQIKPVRYRYKSEEAHNLKHLGVIAQDLKVLFPEMVDVTENEEGNEIYTVDYLDFGVVAMQAIKELNQKIEFLQNKINQLAHNQIIR